LLLTIQDDGRGFDPEKVAASRAQGGGFGLTSISERAAILGGAPIITTAPGQGTAITLRLTLPEKKDDHRDSHSDC
jgi:signal transduction histidine kinase